MRQYEIKKAAKEDLQEILDLQYIAYQSEADLFGTQDIPPLKQTIDEVIEEYNNGVVLKIEDDNKIIGSVRARCDNGTVYIGKLMVHPQYRKRGLGKRLLNEIESRFPHCTYELFTSTLSRDNIRLYESVGYVEYKREQIDDRLTFVYLKKQIKSKFVEVNMRYDCGFEKGNNWFRYRAGGIIIHNNKMLFVKSCIGDYYYMIGGGVHMGETSKDCIEREVYEEAGIHTCVDHLAVVCENFFKGIGGKIDGFDCHTIEFYYYMKVFEEDLSLCKKETDDGEELVWLSLDEIQSSKIKPEFLKENIDKIINDNKIIHVIDERDR